MFLKKTICDICESVVTSNNKYTIPMYCAYPDKRKTVEPVEVDLCEECEKKIADALVSKK